MKFFIKDFFSKCEQICSKLRVLKISSMEKSIFCTVSHYQSCNTFSPFHSNICITLFTQIFSWRRSFKLIFSQTMIQLNCLITRLVFLLFFLWINYFFNLSWIHIRCMFSFYNSIGNLVSYKLSCCFSSFMNCFLVAVFKGINPYLVMRSIIVFHIG